MVGGPLDMQMQRLKDKEVKWQNLKQQLVGIHNQLEHLNLYLKVMVRQMGKME